MNPAGGEALGALSTLIDDLGRCTDLDAVLTTSLDALAGLFGYDHSLLLMLDETGTALYTIASRGYEQGGIGSEVQLGQGVIGRAAAERRPARVNNLQRMLSYARTVLRTSEGDGDRVIPLPGLPNANSQLAAPAMVMGQLVGVLAVESEALGAYTSEDEDLLAVIAHLVGNAIDLDRVEAPTDERERATVSDETPARAAVVRFFAGDGSTFIDDEYMIKGVAGRILWRLVRDYADTGRTDFTNREIRLDPKLELPPFRDNFESRLILLKRRLEEREAPLRIEKTGRGRFRLDVRALLQLEERS
jgi:adenylate cyclase